jgi:hypothetical protein
MLRLIEMKSHFCLKKIGSSYRGLGSKSLRDIPYKKTKQDFKNLKNWQKIFSTSTLLNLFFLFNSGKSSRHFGNQANSRPANRTNSPAKSTRRSSTQSDPAKGPVGQSFCIRSSQKDITESRSGSSVYTRQNLIRIRPKTCKKNKIMKNMYFDV